MPTIFEKIINKELPSKVIFEDKDFLVILDAYPKSDGHSLIIPKVKKQNILLEEEKILSKILILSKHISNLIIEKLEPSGIKIVTNIGKSAGQEVFHTHLHIIPYYDKIKNKPFNDEKTFKKLIN